MWSFAKACIYGCIYGLARRLYLWLYGLARRLYLWLNGLARSSIEGLEFSDQLTVAWWSLALTPGSCKCPPFYT